MKNLNLSLLLFIFSGLNILSAQDIIRTKTDTIQAKVLEIGIDEIKYKDYNYQNGPVIVISKNDVREIIYENGAKFLISPDEYDISKAIDVRSKKHAVKFELFSPVTNDIAFGYERSLKVGTNIEFKLGIIGPGTQDNYENASGAFLKAGVKFLTSPHYTIRGAKYVHALKGWYIKPELIFNTFKSDYVNYTWTFPNPVYIIEKVQQSNIGFNINFGNQHILGNILTLDYYFGIGYGLKIDGKDIPEDYSFSEYSYSHLYLSSDSPLLLTGGLTIGVLF